MKKANAAYYKRELKKAKHSRDAYHAQYLAIREAVRALYYAAYWHADRKVDEAALWTAVRDAAMLPTGESSRKLGSDQTQRYEAVGHAYKDNNGLVSAHVPPPYLNDLPMGETLLFRVK